MEEFKIHVYGPPVGRLLIHMLTYYSYILLDPLRISVESNITFRLAKTVNLDEESKFAIKSNVQASSGKTVNAKASVGVVSKGNHYFDLLTDDGRELFTRKGEQLASDVPGTTLNAYLAKYEEVDSNFSIEASVSSHVAKDGHVDSPIYIVSRGNNYFDLVTDDGKELFTRSGERLAADTGNLGLSTYLTKGAHAESKVAVASRGNHFNNLTTDKGEPLLTRKGEQLASAINDTTLTAYFNKFIYSTDSKLAIDSRVKSHAEKEVQVESKVAILSGSDYCHRLLTDNGASLLARNGEPLVSAIQDDSLITHLEKSTKANGPVGVVSMGNHFNDIITDSGEPLLTRNGKQLASAINDITLPISLTKPVDSVEGKLAIISNVTLHAEKDTHVAPVTASIVSGGNHSNDLLTDGGASLLTRTGEQIVSAVQDDSLDAYSVKSTRAKGSVGVVSMGNHFNDLITDSGAPLLTRKGEQLASAIHDVTLPVSITKSMYPVEPKLAIISSVTSHAEKDTHVAPVTASIVSGGNHSNDLLTDGGASLLTRTGEQIVSAVQDDSLDTHSVKSIRINGAIRVDGEGNHFNDIFTNSNDELYTRNGEQIASAIPKYSLSLVYTKMA